MNLNFPIFTISLDFEIHWGVCDHSTVDDYYENLSNVPQVVKRTLELFKKYKVHATWATVGALFCKNKTQLESAVPALKRPAFTDPLFSSYTFIDSVGKDEESDPFHFARSLILKIKNTPGQEIGTHTFSHYYCLEEGQTPDQFSADLDAVISLANELGIQMNSIVFPRNQAIQSYIDICKEYGVKTYRGTENVWTQKPVKKVDDHFVRRMFRLIDGYLNLYGSHTYALKQVNENGQFNVASSRFMRPFSPSLRILEPLKMKRIYSQMKYAAMHNHIFHLWWHPHNFGKNIDENFEQLEKILKLYKELQSSYSMKSLSMNEIAELLSSGEA